jgi:hypothetical protein
MYNIFLSLKYAKEPRGTQSQTMSHSQKLKARCSRRLEQPRDFSTETNVRLDEMAAIQCLGSGLGRAAVTPP